MGWLFAKNGTENSCQVYQVATGTQESSFTLGINNKN